MTLQELLTFAIVIGAGIYAARVFIRQFTRGESSCASCSRCQTPESREIVAKETEPNG